MKKLFSILAAAAVLTSALVSTFIFGACTPEEKIIRIAASANPHAIILRAIEQELNNQGFELEIFEQGWELQNNVLAGGDVIANFFQHRPFLNNWNIQNNQNLVAHAGIHFEPLGIFQGARSDLNSLVSGDRIIFPNDATNGTRALNLLEKHGLVNWIGGEEARNNVLSNWQTTTQGVTLYPVAAATLTSHRQEAALAVINGNWALQGNIVDLRLVYETDEVGAAYTNVIAIRAGTQNDPRIIALTNALQSEHVKNHISTQFQGMLVANFD
ncbi:MAG: MetQ/NlpA family ABC transporter substrate-binding protein [Firmicutes bacterium]|nr:MetQ/NlpA family ABC transporter substrate-binding protein [Bacillota bacterium]